MKDYFELANIIRTQEKLLGDEVIHCRNLDSSIIDSEIIDREIQNGYDYINNYMPECNRYKHSSFDDYIYTSENNGYTFFHLSKSKVTINLSKTFGEMDDKQKLEYIKSLHEKIEFLEFELYNKDK